MPRFYFKTSGQLKLNRRCEKYRFGIKFTIKFVQIADYKQKNGVHYSVAFSPDIKDFTERIQTNMREYTFKIICKPADETSPTLKTN